MALTALDQFAVNLQEKLDFDLYGREKNLAAKTNVSLYHDKVELVVRETPTEFKFGVGRKTKTYVSIKKRMINRVQFWIDSRTITEKKNSVWNTTTTVNNTRIKILIDKKDKDISILSDE
jgi:hypothetical protein